MFKPQVIFPPHCVVQLNHKTDMNKIHGHSNGNAGWIWRWRKKYIIAQCKRCINMHTNHFTMKMWFFLHLFFFHTTDSLTLIRIHEWNLWAVALNFSSLTDCAAAAAILSSIQLYLRTWHNYCNDLRFIEENIHYLTNV